MILAPGVTVSIFLANLSQKFGICHDQIHSIRSGYPPKVLDRNRPQSTVEFVSGDRVEVKFSKISWFVEGILIEHIDTKAGSDSKLQIFFICSIRISPRKWVIVEKPQQHNFKQSLGCIGTLTSDRKRIKQTRKRHTIANTQAGKVCQENRIRKAQVHSEKGF